MTSDIEKMHATIRRLQQDIKALKQSHQASMDYLTEDAFHFARHCASAGQHLMIELIARDLEINYSNIVIVPRMADEIRHKAPFVIEEILQTFPFTHLKPKAKPQPPSPLSSPPSPTTTKPSNTPNQTPPVTQQNQANPNKTNTNDKTLSQDDTPCKEKKKHQ